MRSSFAAALMGIGGIFVSFAVVVFILEWFTRRTDAVHQLPTMSALGALTLVGGAVLFALGYLLNRMRPARTDGR
jgi:drug/metabolite transporter (DMT)-like permease